MKKKMLWIVVIVGLIGLVLAGSLIYRNYFSNDPSCACALPTPPTGGDTYLDQNGCVQSKSGGVHPDYCTAQP